MEDIIGLQVYSYCGINLGYIRSIDSRNLIMEKFSRNNNYLIDKEWINYIEQERVMLHPTMEDCWECPIQLDTYRHKM